MNHISPQPIFIFINKSVRKPNIKFINDGWTPITKDGKPSAHFEHDVAVGKDKADLLSSFEEIEK